MSSATSAIQSLIPLLSDDDPNKGVHLGHTIWLCRYLDCSIFTASRTETPDFSNNESKDYYKASIQFCSQLVSRYPTLLTLPDNVQFSLDFTLWLTLNLLHISALDRERCLESEPIDCCYSVVRSMPIGQRAEILEVFVRLLNASDIFYIQRDEPLFLSDLTYFNEKFIEDIPQCFVFSESKSTSVVSADQKFGDLKVELQPPVLNITLFECERMQYNLCYLLSRCFKSKIGDLSEPSLYMLYDSTFRQLEFCDLELKEQCINLCTVLIAQNLCVKGALKYTCDFVLGLISFLDENIDESMNSLDSLVLSMENYFTVINNLVYSNSEADCGALFQQENETFFERIFTRSIRLYKKNENITLNRLIQYRLCDFISAVARYLRLNCLIRATEKNDQIARNLKYCCLAFFEMLVSNGDDYDFDQLNVLAKEIALLFYFFELTDDKCHVLTVLEAFIKCSAEKIGDVKNVDSILNVFFIAVNVADCLFHSDYELKFMLWKYFQSFLEHFFGEQHNALKNALEYCHKVNDQNLFDSVNRRVLDICCICANHMSTRMNEDSIRSLYNRCLTIILAKWNEEKRTSVLPDTEKTSTEEINESSIRYYGQIAKFASEEVHEQAVIKLAAAMDVSSGKFVKLVAEQMIAVSAFRRIPLRELYMEVASELMSLLVRKLVANLRQTAPIKENIHFIDEKLTSLLKMKIFRLCVAFGLVKEFKDFPDLTDWRRLSERYIIPYLMMYHCVEATRVHKALASFLKTTRYQLIAQNISHILLQLATSNVGDDEASEIMHFVESECTNSCGQFAEGDDRHQAPRERISFSRLIADNNFRCITSLLTNLCTPDVDELYIFKNLHNVCTVCRDPDTSDFGMDVSSPRKIAFSVSEVIRDLNDKLFGILIIFEEKLRSTNPRQERIIAMRSLGRFFNLSDPAMLGKAALKALSILMYANEMLSNERYSTCPDFTSAISDAWLTFVKALPAQDLQKLCLQILINLTASTVPYKLFEDVLTFFANERNRELKNQISDFSFLLNCSYFDIVRCKIPETLKQFIQGFDEESTSTDVKQELSRILKISAYENGDFKSVCLSRTLHCLECCRDDVYRLVSKSDYIDSTIYNLIEFLLRCLRHSDLHIRNLSAICVGELGAIDPGRLRSDAKVDSSSCNIKHAVAPNVSSMDFDDPNSCITFASQLLTELNKYLIASTDGSTFNMFSYVLQETLKFFECNTEKRLIKNTSAELIWNSLSESVRLSLTPSLSTMYVMHRRPTDGAITYPIFGSRDVVTFRQWHVRFISDLINKINHPRGKEFFKSLEIAALQDLNVSRYILPHVTLQKLKEQDDTGAEMILNEIKTIISNDSPNVSSELSTHVTQEIFSLLDFLYCWSYKSYASVERQLERRRVECFLSEISFDTLSECAVKNQAYTRALMYYEVHINENLAKYQSDSKRDAVLPFLEKLQEIYSHISDVDAVVGILDIRKTKGQPSAKEEVLALECTGNYTEALPFHELLLTKEPEKLNNHKALIKCLLHLNQSNLALRYMDGLIKKNPDLEEKVRPYKIETLCKLADWDTLTKELEKNEHSNAWGQNVASLLQCSRKNDANVFSDKLRTVRDHVVCRLQTAILGSSAYDRAYKHILRLHLISEIYQGVTIFDQSAKVVKNKISALQLIDIWNKRFDAIQASSDVQNCVLETRRQILSLFDTKSNLESDLINRSINKSWLQSLQIARRSGHLQSAVSLLAKVKALKLPEAFEEEAKILWMKGEKDSATNCLSRGINEHYKHFLNGESNVSISNVSADQRLSFAKVQLRMANYAREGLSHEFDDITKMYNMAINAYPNLEDAHYYLAVHLDQLHSRPNYKSQEWCSMRLRILESYGTGLKYGSKFLHHALPRMLTLWLDAASKLISSTDLSSHKSTTVLIENKSGNLSQFNNLMRKFGQILPAYQLYSSFSQMVSRVPHANRETTDVLKEMIARTIFTYGQQCLWTFIAISRSSIAKRREVAEEISKLVSRTNPTMAKLINDFQKLRDLLQNVCFHKDNSFRSAPLKMKERFPELFSLFEDRKFSRIIVPLQSLMDVTLPLPSENDKVAGDNFNPFPNTTIYIESFDNYVEVFPTLQRPKKVGMRGSDGKQYYLLCKPKDDLRIDKRVMEFASLVNIFLLRYPETRRRQLKIRTYAVVPLSEDFGILEWVPNLEAIRSVLLAIYKERGAGLSNDKLRDLCHKSKPDVEKLEIFFNKLLPHYPSVFSLWFRRTFVDPISWYNARTNYVHSAAVMSVVGFVLGLGDRHLENILIDKVMGDLVHVDFNCLFNRGEELEVPELVPFRLTHNMVEAMGPLSFEGPFRKTCEATMRIVRNEKETLRTVLETFLYDPLVEWRKHDERAKQQQLKQGPSTLQQQQQSVIQLNQKITLVDSVSDKAQQHLKNIDFRLSGCVASRANDYGTPLSVEGQINNLIRQATDPKLLSKMYVGWAPYM